MLTKLGRFFFLLIVLGNLSLNHIVLGYCQCDGAMFFGDNPCEEHHCPCEEDEHCPCDECPVEDDCASYFCLNLDEFSKGVEESKALLFEGIAAAEFSVEGWNSASIFQIYFSSNQATGPPGSAIALRHLYAVYLI